MLNLSFQFYSYLFQSNTIQNYSPRIINTYSKIDIIFCHHSLNNINSFEMG